MLLRKKSAKPSANLRANTILTSIPETSRQRKSSNRFPKLMTSSATPRSAKSTTRLATTPTTSIPQPQRLMPAPAEGLAAALVSAPAGLADFRVELRAQVIPVAPRELISAALIFPIYLKGGEEASASVAAEAFETFSPEFSAVEARSRLARNRAPTSSI